jgi:LuxR family maltose regulon positive regulatory protein
MAMRALALQAQGKVGESLAELGQAVELSKTGGFLRVFVDLGAQVQAMLVKLVSMGHSSEAIQRILAAFPDQATAWKSAEAQSQTILNSSLQHPVLVEPLSPREIQVLAHLREPMSIKEIAVKLGVSYATAKRHSINIYGKLGVNSRWDAVAEAVDLGILPDR